MTRIAIIEDDIGLNRGIALALQQEGYEFYPFYTLGEVKDIGQMDLIILDINLPDGNGLDYLKKLRQHSQVPVLILTANDSEMDEVSGLELGAQDYMTKPFSLMVLRIRVEKILKQNTKPNTYTAGKLWFDFAGMEFYRAGAKVELSKTEQRLLYILVENAGQTLSRDTLLSYVWQNAQFVDANALSVTVKRLRDKLETAEDKYIHTVYGIGYMWQLCDTDTEGASSALGKNKQAGEKDVEKSKTERVSAD